MSALLAPPLLVPLAAAGFGLLARRRPVMQRRIAIAAAAVYLAAAVALLIGVQKHGVLVRQVGEWPAPYGITLVADLFSAIMIVLTGALALGVLVYAVGGLDRRREERGYYPLIHVLVAGVSGAFLAGDLFNLFVWFEVTLVASFVLLTLGSGPREIEGGFKYVALNLFGSALFLAAIGLLYGATGTLNLADLAITLRASTEPRAADAIAILFMISFGIKAAAFPLFFWLPASYHAPPVEVSALFAGLLTKVGVYAMVRLFTLVFVTDTPFTHGILLVVAGLTMVTGVLGAIAQNALRRLLAFLVISHIGFLLMGLALLSRHALLGTVYYMMHVAIAKTALFLFAGLALRVRGGDAIDRLGGLYAGHPGIAALFLLSALSLAGIPPFSGFFGKLALIQAGVAQGRYAIVAVALGVSVLTLYSMMKIWTACWAPDPGRSPGGRPGRERRSRYVSPLSFAATAFVVVLAVALAAAAGPLLELSDRAAAQLLDPTDYISAVLGGPS